MQNESHARARTLLDRAIIENLSPDEQRWLTGHTAECAECSRYSELSRRAVRALDSFAFDLDPAAALRVENVVRMRATQLAQAEQQSRSFLGAVAIALLLTIAGSLAMWQPAAWLAGQWRLPAPAWHLGFALFWLLPSALLSALPFFRGLLMGAPKGESI